MKIITADRQAAALAKPLFDLHGWTWWNTEPHPPTEEQIAECFSELRMAGEDGGSVSQETGRLMVRWAEDCLQAQYLVDVTP